MLQAEELHDRARQAVNTGAYARGKRLLDRAAQLTEDPEVQARIATTRAYADAETGNASAGIERCLGLIGEADLTAETRGLVWAQLALLRMRTGDYDEAMRSFEEALSLLPGSRHTDIGLIFLNRGNVHLQRGDAEAAVTDFVTARDELDQAGLPVQRAKAEHNLGYARLLGGELVDALRMIDEAAVVLAPQSAIFRATVEQDRAEILTAAGRPREAIGALEQAATAYGSRRLRTSQAECELTLAWTLLREDPKRARLVARRAARRFRGHASPARALRADAAALVAEISAGATAPSVLDRVDALVAKLRRHGLVQDATVLELQGAKVSVVRGDLADARTRLRWVRVDAASPVTTRLLWREVRSDLAQARGDGRNARQHVRAGL
ncbi:MAG: tetratricopeptide repeat protein, partial [Marmoricola sp.]